MENRGVVFGKLYSPSRIEIKMEKLEGDKWKLRYLESHENPLPEKADKLTVEISKRLGINIKRKGNAYFYTIIGPVEQVVGPIVGEFIQYTALGRLTITEMLALATFGLPSLKDAVKKS